MAERDKELDNGDGSLGRGEVQGCIGFVGKVRVEEEGGMRAEDAGGKGGVGEVDCATEAGWGVDHWNLGVRGMVGFVVSLVENAICLRPAQG